ncbi:glutamine amidotransferase-related protein [Vibrio hepatarius]|uniref:glutamine amidotransferase-related protein n=1 Tax=Vibrio hepatarius TaxID=171383 RepID=UPI001C08E164|nr:glutamine amidotransferase [Vibrio hepatarius]MBU2897366.1 glutamine amidotransferase [Vibrio hepatarius]
MHIQFVIHEAFEGPGYFEYWALRNGFKTSYTRLYCGDRLPENVLGFDILIVLGGPQNPSTSRDKSPHFDAIGEKKLISEAIAHNKTVIGVCLGAQLIGEALGADYTTSPEPEIGSFPITLTDHGINDPLLSKFNAEEMVGHWHSDMPGLTKNAEILAFSQGCPRQIVRYSPLVYGFQCHLELTPFELPDLLENSRELFKNRNDHKFIQSEHEILDMQTSRMNHLLESFLDGLVEKYLQKGIK